MNNSFGQMEGEEVNYSSNQLGCRVIETLLPFASDENLLKFIEAFGQDLRPLVLDRFASHVLQKLIVVAALRGSCKVDEQAPTKAEEGEPEKTEAKGAVFDQWVLKCGNFVMNNLEDFVWDTYGNHVIRTCLECLAGMREGSTSVGKKGGVVKKEEEGGVKEGRVKVPSEFKEVIEEIARRLMMWPQFAGEFVRRYIM